MGSQSFLSKILALLPAHVRAAYGVRVVDTEGRAVFEKNFAADILLPGVEFGPQTNKSRLREIF